MRKFARYAMAMAIAGMCGMAMVLVAHARLSASPGASNRAPQVTRIYTGADGQTHAEEVDVKFGAPNALGLAESEAVKVTSANFAQFAPNFVEDWHHAHARRYVVTLSGKGEIEIGGGQKITLEPGHVLLTEDLSGKGHIARALTNDWTALFVQVEETK